MKAQGAPLDTSSLVQRVRFRPPHQPQPTKFKLIHYRP